MSKIKTLLIIKLHFHLKNLVLRKGNTCERIYFTVKFARLLDIKVKWSYYFKWIRVFRCFCCPYLVIIALISIWLKRLINSTWSYHDDVIIGLQISHDQIKSSEPSIIQMWWSQSLLTWSIVVYIYNNDVISILQIIQNWIRTSFFWCYASLVTAFLDDINQQHFTCDLPS